MSQFYRLKGDAAAEGFHFSQYMIRAGDEHRDEQLVDYVITWLAFIIVGGRQHGDVRAF